MKCVVTGGSGFIGSYVCEELAKDPNNEVVIFDLVPPDADFAMPPNVRYVNGDIRFLEEVTSVVAGADEVYDIAGELGTSELCHANARAVTTNVVGAFNVLEACRLCGVKRVYHPTKPNDWLNTYSITKFSSEQFCMMYQAMYGMNVAVLKWFNAYGPRQHPYPVRKLLPTLCMQAVTGSPLTIFGTGEQTVDLIYVRDIARVCIQACREFGRLGKVLDLGSGEALSVNEVARMVIDFAGSSSKIEYLPMRTGEPEKSMIKADTIGIRERVDMSQFTPLEVGLRETVEYYAELVEKRPDVVEKSFRYWNCAPPILANAVR